MLEFSAASWSFDGKFDCTLFLPTSDNPLQGSTLTSAFQRVGGVSPEIPPTPFPKCRPQVSSHIHHLFFRKICTKTKAIARYMPND